MARRSERSRRTEPQGAPRPGSRVLILGIAILAVWLVSELVAGGRVVWSNAPALAALRAEPRDARQVLLLSRMIPIARDLERLGSELPRDARIFLLGARLEEYYLASYLLHPRTVLVDEPSAVVSGVRGDAVGRALPAARLAGLGITDLVAVDPSHRSLRVSHLAGEKRD